MATKWCHPDDYDQVYIDLVQKPRGMRFLLASPEKPDADSVGCMIAFKAFLAWLRPDAECLMWALEKPKPNTLWKVLEPFCDPMTEIATELPEGYAPDVCVAFDYGNFSRLHLDHLKEKVFCIGFDHHGPDTGFPKYGIEIVGNGAPSATTVLLEFFEHHYYFATRGMNASAAAKALLVGLVADTGHFTNSAATRVAFEAAAKLLDFGADWQEVLRLSRPRTPFAAFYAQTEARKRVVFDNHTGLAFFDFSQEDLRRWRVTEKEVLPLLGVLQGVEGVKIVVAYREEETPGQWYGQIRIPKGSEISAREIAEKFGGGGNPGAAAFKSSLEPAEMYYQIDEILNQLYVGPSVLERVLEDYYKNKESPPIVQY